MSTSDPGFQSALAEAKKGAAAGGIPIGACLVNKDGKIIGSGHNRRVQEGSAVLHEIQAEISTLANTGRLKASAYAGATMYTTLSPCDMCTGACLLYKVARVVVGENATFIGGEKHLKERGVEVVVLDDRECREMMETFIREKPQVWNEDMGV